MMSSRNTLTIVLLAMVVASVAVQAAPVRKPHLPAPGKANLTHVKEDIKNHIYKLVHGHAKPMVGSKVESHHKPASLPAEFKRSLMSLASASRSLKSYLLPSEDQRQPVFMSSQEGRHLTEAQAEWLASHQS